MSKDDVVDPDPVRQRDANGEQTLRWTATWLVRHARMEESLR